MRLKNNNYLVYRVTNNIIIIKLLNDFVAELSTFKDSFKILNYQFNLFRSYEKIIVNGNSHSFQIYGSNLNNILNDIILVFKNISDLYFSQSQSVLFYKSLFINDTINNTNIRFKQLNRISSCTFNNSTIYVPLFLTHIDNSIFKNCTIYVDFPTVGLLDILLNCTLENTQVIRY